MVFRLMDKMLRKASPETAGWLSRHTPLSVLEKQALYHFRQTVRWVGKKSPFYKRAFAARGIDPMKVRVPADLGDFYTTPEDIATCPEDFVCAPPSIVFESSGTTGRNKQVYYSEDELHHIGFSTAIGLNFMGITREDRVANAFDFSIWIPGMVTHYGLMGRGMFSLAFGKVDPIEVYRRLQQYRFTVIMGEPTWLIRLTELAEQHGAYPLKMLVGSAEEMPAAAVKWMESVWKPARVRMSYGSVELGGALGFQPCDKIDGYHVDCVDFQTELLDPDEEGYGEVVFTTLYRKVMPLIRYRSRDVARFDKEPCACGLNLPTMSRLRGRRDELIVASGGNLYPLMFQKILDPVAGISRDWQVVFRLEGVREVMEIHVETADLDGRVLDEEIRRQITAQYPDLMKNLLLGIFQMRILVHPPGSLRVGRKLRRLVDKRHGHPAPEADDVQAQAAPTS
jgi:phenylacetate-CoA ligase